MSDSEQRRSCLLRCPCNLTLKDLAQFASFGLNVQVPDDCWLLCIDEGSRDATLLVPARYTKPSPERLGCPPFNLALQQPSGSVTYYVVYWDSPSQDAAAWKVMHKCQDLYAIVGRGGTGRQKVGKPAFPLENQGGASK